MRSNTIHTVVAFLVLVLLTGCKDTEAYRRAQTAFSLGATVEMMERFAVAEGDSDIPSNYISIDELYQATSSADESRTADSYYEEALTEVTTALKGKAQLEKSFALDNAYAIQALSLWRLERYDQANNVAAIAVPLLEEDEGEESDIRDLAMMQALPGLINIDKAFEALEQIETLGNEIADASDEDTRQAKYAEMKSLFIDHYLSEEDGASSVNRGLALIERAIDNIEGESAISMYLRNAQLAGVDNWGDAFQIVFLSARRLDNSSPEMPWIVEQREAYVGLLRAQLAKLEAVLPNGKEDKLYKYWVRLLGTGV